MIKNITTATGAVVSYKPMNFTLSDTPITIYLTKYNGPITDIP